MYSPKLQNYSRRRCTLSPQQERSWPLNDSASAGTFSERRTYGSRFCLLSPNGYIKNDDWEVTPNANEALQWAAKDVVYAKLRSLENCPFEFLVPTEVHYEIDKGGWFPVNDG